MASSSSVAVTSLDYSTSESQPPYRILNRMSTLFGGKKKATVNHNGSSSSSSVPLPDDNDNETLVASQVDSLFQEERNTSCVDSMYSSLQSRSSRYRPAPTNPDTPAPLRTVQLMDPIVHLPTPPPPPSPPIIEDTPTPPSPTPSTVRKSTPPPGTSSQKVEDVEAQFKLLLVKNLTLKRRLILHF